jgi:hypothetical protein
MKRNNILSVILMAFLAFFLAVGCGEDNPVDDDHDDHHFEAVGVVLTLSGQEIARAEGSTVTGQVEIDEGEDTALISIAFLLEEGGQGVPDEDHYSLSWDIGDDSKADVEQHDEDGKWRFHIHGEGAGSTTIAFKIMHDDHADFVSAPIPVVVNAAGGSAAF